MLGIWILIACISAIFVSLQEIYIKKFVKEDAETIGFATFSAASLIFLGMIVFNKPIISNAPQFIGVLITTVILSAVASILRLQMLKKADISMSTPYMGLIPVFMVFWGVFILKEFPSLWALIGILLVCLGAVLVNYKKGEIRINKQSIIMLIVALLFGLTTTVDKLAIMASSPYTYSLIWSISSTGLYFIILKKQKKKIVYSRHLLVQTVFWVLAFITQMTAVQYASEINSGTTYVKAIIMINIVITTVIGGKIFKEKNSKNRTVASLIMFTGIIALVLFR